MISNLRGRKNRTHRKREKQKNCHHSSFVNFHGCPLNLKNRTEDQQNAMKLDTCTACPNVTPQISMPRRRPQHHLTEMNAIPTLAPPREPQRHPPDLDAIHLRTALPQPSPAGAAQESPGRKSGE